MTFASRRFEVKANPWGNLGTPGLANLSDLMPDDDERLKWKYTQYDRNQASFNPVTGEFYPNYGQHEGIGAGGAPGGNGMMDRIPRISPINEGMLGGGNSNGCPTGFYQFGQVCVPSVDTRGGSGSDLAGAPGTFFGKGDAKGVINAITPPQFTTKNQEFIVLTDMQNIGGQPAKFYTKVGIPEINITADVSNSTMVMPLAKTKIGHRIIMPLTVTSNNLLQATVELIRIPLTSTGAETTDVTTMGPVDDRGQVAIPSPNYRGPQPPVGGGMYGAPNSGYPLGPGGFLPPPYGGGSPGMGGFPMPPMPFPFPPPMGGGGNTATLVISPPGLVYPAATLIQVSGYGFLPNEKVSLQTYIVTNISGLMKYSTRISNKLTTALPNGYFNPLQITIPGSKGVPSVKYAIVAFGNTSQRKAEQLITGVGENPIPYPNLPYNPPIPNSGGNNSGGSGSGGLPNFGNMFPPGFPFNNQPSTVGGYPNPATNTQGFMDALFNQLGINN